MTESQHMYRGSVTKDGKFGSARDFGNMAAGVVAGRNGLSWGQARVGFDALESYQRGAFASEPATTQKAQRVGYDVGISLRSKVSQRDKFRQRELQKIKNK